ncbi:hypothetical protein F5B21DRAFT_516870 [Xylaria acuta]|nr:hypothetical protein F5B21DRAFT_516870 [Xylaria acuta]
MYSTGPPPDTGTVFANRPNLWWNFVVVGSTLSLAYTGLILAQTKYVRHQWDAKACWYNGTYIKILFAQAIVASFVLFFSQPPIFLLFHRIFDVARSMRIAIRCGIIFAALLYVIINIPLCAILNAPRVGETRAYVDISGRPEKVMIWAVVQSILAIGLDLVIFILPFPVIMKLHLSTEKKIRLLAVFTVAAVGVIACVLSLAYRIGALGTSDITRMDTTLLICNVVEADVAIIASCTPGFANFTRTYLPKLEIFKSLCSSTNSGLQFKYDPNRPRTGKRLKRPVNYSSNVLDDAYILQSTMLAKMGMSTNPVSLRPTPRACENS